MHDKIEIMDTTLRDGEQTDGVSFSLFDKKQISRILLEQLQVDRIEIASARVSEGEHKLVAEIFAWAADKGCLDRIEILGFVDYKASVDWITSAGGRVINLLTKGSRKHCEEQLRRTPAEHLADIEKTVMYAAEQGLKVNMYMEDWSNGFLNSPDYVEDMLKAYQSLPVNRMLLPDTLGIMAPEQVTQGIRHALEAYAGGDLDFHGHNDYGLAVANCLAAVKAGVRGVHVAINGLGERAGNSPLESVVTALHDMLGVKTSLNEKAITDASRIVATFSGKRVASNQPVVGQDVFTQTAGIHADGDKKNNLYANLILPERFGRERVYALGKLAGRASITNNLKTLGIELSREREEQLLKRVIELGEQKTKITGDDLPFIIEDLFGEKGLSDKGLAIKVVSARVSTELGGERKADVALEYRGKVYERTATGDGGYNAFMNALGAVADELNLSLPILSDYEVRIPPGGKTDALVETVITWQVAQGGHSFRTVGVDCDQTIAAINATEKMLNRLVASEGEGAAKV